MSRRPYPRPLTQETRAELRAEWDRRVPKLEACAFRTTNLHGHYLTDEAFAMSQAQNRLGAIRTRAADDVVDSQERKDADLRYLSGNYQVLHANEWDGTRWKDDIRNGHAEVCWDYGEDVSAIALWVAALNATYQESGAGWDACQSLWQAGEDDPLTYAGIPGIPGPGPSLV